MKKKYYLEVIRILAVLLVMFNHSAAYMSFANLSGLQYVISFVLSLICKAAVPLFYMVSGTLLLGKNESFKELFKKRIVRIIVVIVIFSTLYYLKLVLRGQAEFAPLQFIFGLPFDVVYLSYWYLYSYLGILVILPILRPLAQNMSKNTVWYLIALQVIMESVMGTLSFFGYRTLCGYFGFGGLFQSVIFYPLIGYGLDKYMVEEKFWSEKNIFRNVACVLVTAVAWRMVYVDSLNNGAYREMHLGTWVPLITIVLFMDMKLLVKEECISEKAKRILGTIGGCTFGIYLLDPFIGAGGKLDVIYQKLMPYIGFIPAFLVEIAFIFVVRTILVWIMKKLPILRKVI